MNISSFWISMLISHLRMRFWMFRIVNPSRRVDEISVKNRAIWRGWGRVSLETWIANHFHQLETFESPKFYYPVIKDMDIPFIRYPIPKHIWFFFSQGRICYMFVPMTRMVHSSHHLSPLGTQGRSLARPLLWCYLASLRVTTNMDYSRLKWIKINQTPWC